MNKYRNSDLLTHGLVDAIKLSKSLFQECNISSRVISNVTYVRNNFIAFINAQKSHKEKF